MALAFYRLVEKKRHYHSVSVHPGGVLTFLLGLRGAAALLAVLHVTPMGGVLPHKKGLEPRLHLLLKDGTLLIGLHRFERVPEADGKAAVGILDILGQPPSPQAGDGFARDGRLIRLLKLMPSACPQFPPGNPRNHDGSS